MKKIICLSLVCVFLLTSAACGKNPPVDIEDTLSNAESSQQYQPAPEDGQMPTPAPTPTAPKQPFEGKIAIVTNSIDQDEDEYLAARQLIEKYDENKIIHATWPVGFMGEPETMRAIIDRLSGDPEVKVFILVSADPRSNQNIDLLPDKWDDQFVICYSPGEKVADVIEKSDLILYPNEAVIGSAMVKQAKKMGAVKFAHYSFPRHMSMPPFADRREEIKKTCDELGMEYIDLTALDPTSDVGVSGAQRYILEDVPKQIAKYGENTAFFSTNCALQIPLIKAVVGGHAIYPQPCCPSPYHGFPTALGFERIVLDEYGLGQMRGIKEVIADTKRIAAENNMTGRLSTWSVSASMVSTAAAAEYAVKWLNGEVPKDNIDVKVLEKCMADYIAEYSGEEGLGVYCTPLVEDGLTYDNYLLISEDYLTY